MTHIHYLPPEIITIIGEFCVLEKRRRLRTKSEHADSRQHTRALNALARASRPLYEILNPLLYRVNIKRDYPLNSCVLWAAEKGELGTIKDARRFCDADLNANGTRNDMDKDRPWSEIPGRLEYFATPLHLAIHHGHQHIVQYLLDNNVNVHVESRGFCACGDFEEECYYSYWLPPAWYPLHTALNHSRVSGATEQLILQGGAYMVAEDEPVLPILERKGAKLLIKKLLNNEAPEARAFALLYSVQFNDPDPFRRLIKIPSIDTTVADNKWCTPLHWASLTGQTEFVQGLLEAGADPEIIDMNGYTPIHSAACNGHIEVLKLLINVPGVNAAKTAECALTPLHFAASEGNESAVRLLVERPETEVSAQAIFGKTPLQFAIASKNQTHVHLIIRCLIDHGALIDDTSDATYTALFTAIKHLRFEVAKTLLRCGSNPLHHQNSPRGGWTVLHECLRRPALQQRELVAALIAKGADVNALIDEDTALDEFERDRAYWSADDAIKRDPSRKLICGCTPLFLATVGAGDIECMRLLLAAGARTDVRIVGSIEGDPFDPYSSFYRRSGPKSLLTCIFLHLWGNMHHISSEDVNTAADRICLLLEHGERIDAGDSDEETVDFISPLRFACESALQRDYALLDLLLDSADKTNASLEYLEEVRGENSLDLEVPHSYEIVERIQSFIDREYPRADSVL